MTSSIRSARERRGLRWALVLCLAGLAPRPAGGGELDAQIRTHLKLAQRAYDLGQFDEALRDFSEAYRLKPLPGILFNLAQCHRQMRSYERAAFFYRRYL